MLHTVPTEMMIHAEHLTRSFGSGPARRTVLRDVSLALPAGELTLLMGPSGSGKTTLLGILSGLLKPDVGRVVALGEDIWRLSEAKREQFRRLHCGFIFQGYNLFPALTALEQLEIVLRWGSGKTPAEARDMSAEILTRLGLGDKLKLRPQQLSGGEKQRVAIGRALIKQPKFIFADEPTAALDWEHGRQVAEMLHYAAHEHRATVLLVTHDYRLEPYADRLVHLEDGAILEKNDPLVQTALHDQSPV